MEYKTAIINEDIFSIFGLTEKNRKPLFIRGEKVKIISESLPALIIEKNNGDRWPVNIKRLTINNDKT